MGKFLKEFYSFQCVFQHKVYFLSGYQALHLGKSYAQMKLALDAWG